MEEIFKFVIRTMDYELYALKQEYSRGEWEDEDQKIWLEITINDRTKELNQAYHWEKEWRDIKNSMLYQTRYQR